ncbi:hypothetical protein BDQ17DRAFT_1336534 [Cyathus striatus]|nr:hypothetical protein BDQ17DRAFT_1336534 [Cyathus striatus]
MVQVFRSVEVQDRDPSIHQKHPRDGTHYQELLNTEKLDGSGCLRPKLAASNADSNSTNIKFLPLLEENSDSEGEEEDNGNNVVITNEIAASIPRKLAPKTKEVSRKLVTKIIKCYLF